MPHNTLLAPLLLLLSLFSISVLASPKPILPGTILTIRQDTGSSAAPGAMNTSIMCETYARTANLSTIGSNSTYRATFLQASPAGSFSVAKMFKQAMDALPAMTRDAQLNAMCGNSTTVAVAEAERNFTKGTVLQFAGLKGNAQEISAGPHVAVIVLVVCAMFGSVWLGAP